MLLFCFMRTEATMHLLLNCMVVQLGLGEVVQNIKFVLYVVLLKSEAAKH